MATAKEHSERMRAQLKLLDPEISAEPVTVERKIIDTVAEEIASASIDPYVLNYQLDIDTKVGVDLDKFAGLFGFARQGGRRATGSVTFSRGTNATSDIFIPAGTQVIKPATSVSTQSIFFTTAGVVLPFDGFSVEAPIEASDIGPLGNVSAGTIILLGTGATDVSEVTNENATTGGSSDETDAEFRIRFKNTIFRNVAGTPDQYLALAIATRFSNKAHVIGPINRYIEYAQILSGGTVTSLIPYSKYTYNFDYFLTNGDLTNEVFFAPRGSDYTFTASVPPSFTVNNSTSLPAGAVVLLEHSFCSVNSRNDPTNNIANYVDVYVSGQNGLSATEAALYPTSANNFNTTVGSPFKTTNFRRVSTGTAPIVGNRFQELLWQPVLDLPSVITINGVDYLEGTHYWLVRDTTIYRGSKRSRDGIEWASGTLSLSGTPFFLTYVFDKLPLELNELMESHKQITTDVLVHRATRRFFNVNAVVMYTPGSTRSSVDDGITAALITYFNTLDFGAIVQISDILEFIHEVPGVDNVRIANTNDNVPYGIQEIAEDGVTIINMPLITDFTLQDSDLPVLNNLVTTQRSQNTW